MAADGKSVQAVKGLDIAVMAGKWYTIASIPPKGQPTDSSGNTTTYTVNKDGASLKVVNEAIMASGKHGKVEGKLAKAKDAGDEARFGQTLWVPPFAPIIPVHTDIWVMATEEGENPQYMLHGQPAKQALWIHSRTPELPKEVVDKLLQMAADQGFDLSKLIYYKQSTPEPAA
ncbi:unnamed protein product [Closterium sp. NIES-53]